MKITASHFAFVLLASAQVDAFTQPAFKSKGLNGVAGSTSRLPFVAPADGKVRADETSLSMGIKVFKGWKSTVPTEDEVRALFHLWNDALQTGDSRIVAKRYAKDPVLLPTVSDSPRTQFSTIKDYFDTFLLKKPKGKILYSKITTGKNWAMDAGIYEFTMVATGQRVKARYSFVYTFEDDEWKIQHHHSSILPEGLAMGGQQITEQEVKNLFGLWNSALASGDSATVAKRYSKDAVLLPTVSDVARTSPALIKDYFDAFLLKKPQGEILESNVIIGTNWAQDAGLYEFTMGATGDKVKGRYSFIYVLEDGEWKISHHHSSVMPEGILGAPIDKGEVRKLFNKWNDALATLDSSKVANCYSREAVLLPTVSDTPRTNKALITDYFDAFLLKKPQGEILYGDVMVGTNWAQDAGIYEFTMGADGSKVKGRYTFVYVYEDGEWKISQHHSSVMPEPLLAGAAAKAEEPQQKVEIKVNGAPKVEVVTEDANELAELVA